MNHTTSETIHIAGYYYVMYSDPNNADTDEDGLEDNEDITPNEETVVIDSQTAEALILY